MTIFRSLRGVVGGLLVGISLAAAAISLVWTPHNPLALNLMARLAPPGGSFLLGTDEFGRDVLSRLMTGAGASISISIATVIFAVTIGTVIGVLTGFFRGWTDRIVMTFNDALLAFPGILLALGLLVVLGASRPGIILALGLAYTPSVARVVRGTVLSLRENAFIEASRVMGHGEVYTMLRHILPNCIAPLTVLATSMFGWVLLSESALSFLGLGAPPPSPSWGNMLSGGRAFMSQAPWLGIFPGLCISLTLLGINLLGDALRDRLDPRMRNIA
ncbi:ABC transporter permease (plasmid) [Tistrella bauzanensis]|jgi:peptide/nickel transport system permease protein|uniref:ABC transporter permease n=1 Tax=Tistrella arctica TaxID=3133430 RepID=A0ABU9YM89_9PROT